MSTDPWMKFYPQDWRSDEKLRMCSLAARGLWIEMLAIMHRSERYGHLLIGGRSPTEAQLAVQAGAPSDQVPELIAELELAGVFSRTSGGVIFSRRMMRDDKKAQTARKNGKKGGNPSLSKQMEIKPLDNQSDKPTDKGGLKAQKPEARYQTITRDVAPRTAREPQREISADMARVCNAAGMTSPPGDMRRLGQWITAGADVDRDVIPIVERITGELRAKSDRPQSFKLFEPHVLAVIAARKDDDEAWSRKVADIAKRYPGPSVEPAVGGYDDPAYSASAAR